MGIYDIPEFDGLTAGPNRQLQNLQPNRQSYIANKNYVFCQITLVFVFVLLLCEFSNS